MLVSRAAEGRSLMSIVTRSRSEQLLEVGRRGDCLAIQPACSSVEGKELVLGSALGGKPGVSNFVCALERRIVFFCRQQT
jgi:hypothetical protein